jgi:hypothetical protein
MHESIVLRNSKSSPLLKIPGRHRSITKHNLTKPSNLAYIEAYLFDAKKYAFRRHK